MKFLCENCKAKYQIADDKVAGRTVRMKCRRCGHLIEVEASVTETSVASKIADLPGAEAVSEPPPKAAPPRPGVASGTTQRKPPQPGAGLAGAFSKAVVPPAEGPSAMSTAVAVLSSANLEEWYAGINGVPVGPMRLSELRRRAQQGFVDEETLVWRDGLEEWVPLRTFPELCALLKEAAATARTSLTPAPSSVAPAVSKGPAPSRLPAPRPPVPRPVVPPPPSRSNVVPLAPRRVAAERVVSFEDALPEVEISVDTDVPTVAPPAVAPVSAPAVLAAPPAIAAPARERRERESIPDFRRRRGVPTIAWFVAILVGVLGGMVIMLVVARQPQAPPAPSAVPVVVTVAVPAQAKAESDDTSTTIGQIEVAVAQGARGTTGAKPVAGKVEPAPGGAGPAPAPTTNSLSGLTGLVGGPTVAAGGPSGGGGQLTEADISRVVQSRRAFVSRRCWEPALSGRGPNAPTNAKVLATLSIAADGHVTDANTSGGDAFPGLASCVQGQVKSWTFPRNDGGTTTKIPFVFAGQ